MVQFVGLANEAEPAQPTIDRSLSPDCSKESREKIAPSSPHPHGEITNIEFFYRHPMTTQRAGGLPPSFKPSIRARTLAIFLLITLLATVISSLLFGKPYHGTLEVTIASSQGNPTPIFAYFSPKPGNYNPNHFAQSYETLLGTDHNSHTVLHRIELASSKPLNGIRLDPGTSAGTVKIKDLNFKTSEGVIVFTPEEIQKMLGKGSNMDSIQISEEFVTFNATNNDPHFNIVIPKPLATPSIFSRTQDHIKTWLGISLPIIAAFFFLLYRNGLPLLNESHLTISHWIHSIRTRAFIFSIIDAAAIAAFAITAQHLISMHAGIRLEPLMDIFVEDGVGNSVPNEVKSMKAIVSRQGIKSYALAGDLGREREWGEVYQRATEYLYPAHIDQASNLAFVQSTLKSEYEARPCQLIDMQHDILLYDCKK